MRAAKQALSAISRAVTRSRKSSRDSHVAYTPIVFDEMQRRAHELADHIETHFEELAHVLLEYESYEVVVDEISRTLDLLRNLEENREYFTLRVGPVAAFLPRNQPLYALSCFVLVPALMASEVHFRIPHSMRHFFPKLLSLLEIQNRFPNVCVSNKQRLEFLRERSALRMNPLTRETLPVTEVVIFTGNSLHADQLRIIFDRRTLFITNGSGHNPVVVGADANLADAVEAVLALQLYNQGQDCAAPNAILVHQERFAEFLRMLRDAFRTVRVGDYRDRKCRVGPISDPKDLVRIQDFLIDHREWLDPTTPGIIRSYDAILEPTIINKPLASGGNYNEIFAPVVFVQKYGSDNDLATYFEDPRYAQNAMYVTLYGSSEYVSSLIDREVNGKILHDARSFLHNTHLHASGQERGTQPYGGNGYGASSISINDHIVPKATLPQRDIYEWIVQPLQQRTDLEQYLAQLKQFTELREKNVEKLLRLKAENKQEDQRIREGTPYLDLEGIPSNGHRYARIDDEHLYRVRERPNTELIARMSPMDLEHVRALRALVLQEPAPSQADFKTALYAIPKRPGASKESNAESQLCFFQTVYQLVLGQTTGPRLPQFLLEIDRVKLGELLDV